MQMMRHGSFVELNADELGESLTAPTGANGVGGGQTCLVVRMDGNFNGGGRFSIGHPAKDGVDACRSHVLSTMSASHPIPEGEVSGEGLQFVAQPNQPNKLHGVGPVN